MYPLFYSPEKDNNKQSSFFDLYSIARNFNLERFLTVSFASTIFPKISQDYPKNPNSPVSLSCSLSESELEKVMDDVRKPQLKFKDSNILLRFSFTCSIRVLPGGESIGEDDTDFDDEDETASKKTELKTVEMPEWENYRSLFAEPMLKIKAKLDLSQEEEIDELDEDYE